MPITPATPFPKARGDTVRSTDWNQVVNEVIRLDNTKVNRAGDTVTGQLSVNAPLLMSGVTSRLQISQSAPANESLVGGTIALTGGGTGNRQGLSVSASGAGFIRGLSVDTTSSGAQLTQGLTVSANGSGGTGFAEALSIVAQGGAGGVRGLLVSTVNASDQNGAEAVNINAFGDGKGPRTGLSVFAQGGANGGSVQGATMFTQVTGDTNGGSGLGVSVFGDGKAGRTALSVSASAGANGAGVTGQILSVSAGANGGTGLSVVTQQPSGGGSLSGLISSVSGDGTGFRTAGSFSAHGGANGAFCNALVAQAIATGSNQARGLSIGVSGNGTGLRYGAIIGVGGAAGGGHAVGADISASAPTDISATGINVSASGGGAGVRYGIFASVSGTNAYAGFFSGNVHVAGTLSKAAGSFLIDHPTDPRNKTLRHNLVESPEHLCIYRGQATLDENGKASVELPRYFAALTDEDAATVYLTPLGSTPFAASYAWNRKHTAFAVHGTAGAEVAYMVLADRDDPVARRLRQPVEETKGPRGVVEKGQFLNPEAYEEPLESGVTFAAEETMAAVTLEEEPPEVVVPEGLPPDVADALDPTTPPPEPVIPEIIEAPDIKPIKPTKPTKPSKRRK
jgi:hypothetical protein